MRQIVEKDYLTEKQNSYDAKESKDQSIKYANTNKISKQKALRYYPTLEASRDKEILSLMRSHLKEVWKRVMLMRNNRAIPYISPF